MPDLITGLIRTLATLLIGATITAVANLARRELGLELTVDDTTKATLISGTTAFVSMLWYAVFATLERRWPAFGVFLGWPKAPHYDVEGEVTRRVDEEHEQRAQELPSPRSRDQAWRSTRRGDPLP